MAKGNGAITRRLRTLASRALISPVRLASNLLAGRVSDRFDVTRLERHTTAEMNELFEASWRIYPGAALVVLGVLIALRGFGAEMRAFRSAPGDPATPLAMMRGFRRGIFGFAVAGVKPLRQARWSFRLSHALAHGLAPFDSTPPLSGRLALQARLAEILHVELSDDRLAWELGPDGCWRRARARADLDAQERFKSLAHERERQSGASIT